MLCVNSLLVCVQTSPLSQKKKIDFFFLRERGTSVHRLLALN